MNSLGSFPFFNAWGFIETYCGSRAMSFGNADIKACCEKCDCLRKPRASSVFQTSYQKDILN